MIKMRKVIISMSNCQKCAMLKAQCPDAECVTAKPEDILPLARVANIQSMPFVVCVGERMNWNRC